MAWNDWTSILFIILCWKICKIIHTTKGSTRSLIFVYWIQGKSNFLTYNSLYFSVEFLKNFDPSVRISSSRFQDDELLLIFKKQPNFRDSSFSPRPYFKKLAKNTYKSNEAKRDQTPPFYIFFFWHRQIRTLAFHSKYKHINSPPPSSYFGVIKPRSSHENVPFFPFFLLFSFLFSLSFPTDRQEKATKRKARNADLVARTTGRFSLTTAIKCWGKLLAKLFANVSRTMSRQPCLNRNLDRVTNALSVYIPKMTPHLSVLMPPLCHLRTLFPYIVSAPGMYSRVLASSSSPPPLPPLSARSFTNEKYG